ncbi:hypothetical protein DFJ43DRAFT_1068730 [Lentinula guzmanii]|uniref:Secreted protein n=1 Tax=Lentinula guzmanii TaxID=2804957 RepID=A0AA38MUM8_9AGAR|nr:hypothetical protein DFJ43DRAFT_1068730 [Lentinula guzmanii]
MGKFDILLYFVLLFLCPLGGSRCSQNKFLSKSLVQLLYRWFFEKPHGIVYNVDNLQNTARTNDCYLESMRELPA